MKRRQLLLAGAGLPLVARAHAPSAEPGARIDWPPIELIDGRTLEPAAWAGQAAVVVFWATDCAYCQRHNVHVDKLYRATRGQPLRVLGVALDTDADAVRRLVAARGYGFPVALDGSQLRQRLTPRRVIPMTCLLDRSGRLLQAIPGEMSEDDVLGLARTLLRPAA
jgi:thiol-disulfide isomerase/thioredoxin